MTHSIGMCYVIEHTLSSYHTESLAIKCPAHFLSLGTKCMTCQKMIMKAEILILKGSEIVDLNTKLTLNDNLGALISPQPIALIFPNPGQRAV